MKNVRKIYIKYKEIINYLIFGVLTTLVNFGAYFMISNLLKIDEIISNIIAWFISVLFAYITNKIFVFESNKTGFKEIFIEVYSFFMARILSAIFCDIGTFAFMIKILKINDVISKIVTQIMVVIMNYILSKFITFKKDGDKENVK